MDKINTLSHDIEVLKWKNKYVAWILDLCRIELV